MDQRLKQVLVVFCVFIDVYVYTQDCIYQECFCADTIINCEARGLNKLPNKTSSATQYTVLNLDMNGITDIPGGSLPPNLTGIFLDENPTTTISDTAFDDCLFTLNKISFSYPLFTIIPDAFRRLKALEDLYMVSANIQDWNEEAMRNIGQTMLSLQLDNVGITSWPNWLQYFCSLTELILSRGSISSVPDDALDNMANTLISITLTGNNLTTVPKALSNCTVLQNVYIQDNKIVDVTWLPRASRLFTLWLSSNFISDADHLSNALFPFKDTLGSLDVSSNRLTAIPTISFLTLVTNLYFSDNRLSDPNSGSLASTVSFIDFSRNLFPVIPRVLTTLHTVSQLNLPSNYIRQIHGSDFPSSTVLVDLGFNLITELTDDSFPTNSNITSIKLNNNPIVTISNMALKNLRHLVELNLQSTRLSRLPLTLASLTTLYYLDMTDIANLVCTCQENSLELMILNIPRVNVLGKCGLVSIYQFFVTFSPLCPSQGALKRIVTKEFGMNFI